jgi:hypothetical protein
MRVEPQGLAVPEIELVADARRINGLLTSGAPLAISSSSRNPCRLRPRQGTCDELRADGGKRGGHEGQEEDNTAGGWWLRRLFSSTPGDFHSLFR